MTNLPDVSEWVKSLVPDLDERIEAFQVDTDFLDDELIDAFKEEIAQQAALMKSGVDNERPDDIRAAAHSIKGMGGTIGLPEISVLAHEVELRSKRADMPGCKLLVAEFLVWATKFTES